MVRTASHLAAARCARPGEGPHGRPGLQVQKPESGARTHRKFLTGKPRRLSRSLRRGLQVHRRPGACTRQVQPAGGRAPGDLLHAMAALRRGAAKTHASRTRTPGSRAHALPGRVRNRRAQPEKTANVKAFIEQAVNAALDQLGIDAEARSPVVVEHSRGDRKSTRLNSSHVAISYAVFCLK